MSPLRSRAAATVATAALGVVALAASDEFVAPCRLIYNATSSAPRGWYVLVPAQNLPARVYVFARLPPAAAQLAAARAYLPASLPILKQIVASSGDHVCTIDDEIHINGHAVARPLTHDSADLPLPAWRACRTLTSNEFFLLNPAHPASFDSRYFGPVTREAILGIAIPLYTY